MRSNLIVKEQGLLPKGYDVNPNKQRQGDVYINYDESVPGDVEPRADRVLALGEATGHSHTISVGIVYGNLSGDQWIELPTEANLFHQVHETQVLRVGSARVDIQREYTPEAIRRVSD